eukprot:2431727-Prymnesium_polylepis.1
MRVYVTLQPARDKPAGKTVYSLLLPDDGAWGEVAVAPSPLEGFGVLPRDTPLLQWSNLETPVLMCAVACRWCTPSRTPPGAPSGLTALPPPLGRGLRARRPYLGVECVTHDQHLLRLLLQVLRGEFELTTAEEVCRVTSRSYVQDGICAVVHDPSAASHTHKLVLAPQTELLQVAHSASSTPCKSGVRQVCSGGDASVCYLIGPDIRELLQLTGARSHLWELLKAHS